MKNQIKYIFVLFAISMGFSLVAQDINSPSVMMDGMMNLRMLRQAKMGNLVFLDNVCRTDGGFFILSTADQAYLLGLGGIGAISQKDDKKINSFTLVDGILFAIRGRELCYLDTTDRFVSYKKLPHLNMKIYNGTNGIYLTGRVKSRKGESIYAIRKSDDAFIRLIDVPTTISAVTEFGPYIIFATANSIYGLDTSSKKVFKIIELPNKREYIISLIYDKINDYIYFSSKKGIYRIEENGINCLNNNAGGVLCYDPDGLVVFNVGQKEMYRLRNSILLQKK